ncbi:MAG: copper resistance protein NlpE [Muribaculaceae bacterium]|nr:copper resistance protein NlpE [Muribaculaceae bacterium]
MKKSLFMAGIAALTVVMGACTAKQESAKEETTSEPKSEVFTGVLPAADCDGIRYTLNLDYTDAEKGTYKLDETYLMSDSTSTSEQSFPSKGEFTVSSKDAKTYITLNQKAESDSVQAYTMYFLVDSDSTITMANSDMEVSSAPGLNYTLTLVK